MLAGWKSSAVTVDLPTGVKEWTLDFERVRDRTPTRKP